MISAHTPRSPRAPLPVAESGRAASTARKKPRHLEDALQATCVKWFRLQYPEYAALLFAIPNGGQRNAREGARLKAQGVTAGVPDLLLACPAWPKEPGAPSFGLFLELKIAPNKASKEQHAMMDKLVEFGYTAKIVYSFEAFREAVKQHLGC